MKKRKGFTLVELLAVIVILGLVMAIAIPSVTKYITQSRKKTLETSIREFTTALTIEVNDSQYDLENDNLIYAIPIECIDLEKGGENPFGKWMPANNKQWAYVLVQYNSEKRDYIYGFTFMDTAGYGLYPTEVSKLNGEGKIKQDLKLSKPINGSYTEIADEENWEGFDLSNDPQIYVFSARESGNGRSTCTIMQAIDRNEVPDIDEEVEEPEIDDEEMEDEVVEKETQAYAIYSSDNNSLTFVRLDETVNVKAGDVFLGNVVTNIYTGFENTKLVPWSEHADKITRVIFNDEIYPLSTSSWFNGFVNLDSISNIDNLHTYRTKDMKYMFFDAGKDSSSFVLDLGNNFDTSNVTDMDAMFYNTGQYNKNFTLDLGDKFDTSNVTRMYAMFYHTGYSSLVFKLNLGNKFDTSKVTSMRLMFCSTGYSSPIFTLNLGDKFNTSNVTDMLQMFYYAGYSSKVMTLDLGDKFDTSKVTEMYCMFALVGYESTVFTLNLGDKFDTSKVTDMSWMFNKVGHKSTVFTLDLGDKFDTSNVTDMELLFHSVGAASPTFTLDLGDKFDTSKVTNMRALFAETGYSNPNFTLDLGDKFDTRNVTDMEVMFEDTGYLSRTFTLDLGDKFDTSNVTIMDRMFNRTGYSSSAFKIDCTNWNVDKVTSHKDFNTSVETKVIAPTWK